MLYNSWQFLEKANEKPTKNLLKEIIYQCYIVNLQKNRLGKRQYNMYDLGHVQNPLTSKSTQSNLRTAYQLRVRVRGNSDSEKLIKNKQEISKNF